MGSSLDLRDVYLNADDGSKYLVPSLREPVGFYLLIDGVYESKSINFIADNLPQNSIFLDIGANIGLFSIKIAKFLGQESQVIAVEASPKIFTYLQHNIKNNYLPNIKALELAITDIDNSTINFYEPPVDHFGMGSIAPQFHNNPVLVNTKTIDTLIKELQIDTVNIIKVDVEGYEYMVFKGGQRLFNSAHPPLILFEFCDWAESRVPGVNVGDSQRILLEYGYKIWRLEDFLSRKQPLNSIITKGFDMLVAVKNGQKT
ncbi:MAG: FkbM family methyltransferase [Chlorogloeopsis fritschii C42_A2020_084]|uniref:FkbM family methyltransferase n=1 Tax=Chlorogloeopsis fritschii TaxID=1124 RepID=UPI001A007994|nr:FkbM family methyltransferase [Chlorogloeopsis fritschii]MBF2004231.1 FkbM family methyltransferase [Chlorogloeopsis fritschii C42_A2020_084]